MSAHWEYATDFIFQIFYKKWYIRMHAPIQKYTLLPHLIYIYIYARKLFKIVWKKSMHEYSRRQIIFSMESRFTFHLVCQKKRKVYTYLMHSIPSTLCCNKNHSCASETSLQVTVFHFRHLRFSRTLQNSPLNIEWVGIMQSCINTGKGRMRWNATHQKLPAVQ